MLRTLGGLNLTNRRFTRPVPLFLLAYLAYEGGHHDRRDLARLFWPARPLDESYLTPLANDIVARIEQAFLDQEERSVTVSLDQLDDLNLTWQQPSQPLADAHNSLKLHGFISDVHLSDDGRNDATYLLTSSYLIQLSGAPLTKLSHNKLRNALHKLGSLGEHVIIKQGRHVHTAIDTDLAALRRALDANDVDQVLGSYGPFLADVEALLTKSRYDMSSELTTWLSGARREVARRVQETYLADARQQVFHQQYAQAEYRVFAALDASDEKTLSDEAYNIMLDLLVAGESARVPEARERMRALAVPHAPTADAQAAEERLKDAGRFNLTINRQAANPSREFVNLKTWQISASHLSPLMNVDLYDERGNRVSGEDGATRKYSEELYVPPRQHDVAGSFFKSNKRALVLVGKSGSGKSNLLCHSFLKQRREGQLTVFLNARLFAQPNIAEVLKAQVLGRIVDEWRGSFRPLDTWLGKSDRKLFVYLDAVNEYSNSGGPLALLEGVINFVEDMHLCANVKLLVACRTETWKEFKAACGDDTPLRDASFESHARDAVKVAGFASEERRRRLFQTYQAHFELYPKRYEAQSHSFRQLIKMPFMMSVIADTYTNRGNTGTKTKVPRDLDYLRVFQHMTDRKLKDATLLLNASDPKRDLLESELQDCLLAFAHLVYDKLAGRLSGDDADRFQAEGYDALDESDRSDAVGIDRLNQAAFQRFLEPFSQSSSISVFRALIQLNLIEETTLAKSDFWDHQREIKAYKFYHDQYAQYWLSAILGQTVLGRVSTESLTTNNARLEAVGTSVADLLTQAKNTPLLAGAVEYWLYANMASGKGVQDYLVVLFDFLAAKRSGSISYYIGMFLHSLIEKNVTTAQGLYETLFVECGHPLKQALAYTYLERWPNVSPGDFKAFLDALDAEADSKTVRIVADIFADLYVLDPTRVIDFLDGVLYSSEKAMDFLMTGLLRRQGFTKQLTFVVQFALKALHYSASSSHSALPLRDFLVRRYNYLIEALTSDNAFGLRAQLKAVLYRKLEESGIGNWNEAVGPQGDNNLFFVEEDGVVQRDVLYDYYKYVVALHNGDYHALSLRENQEFRALTLEMLTYRPGSVLGYVSMVVAAALSAEKEDYFDLLLNDLLDHDTEASRFSIGAMSTTAVHINHHLAEHVLDRLEARFVPHQVKAGLESEEIVNSFISVAASDLNNLGPTCRTILDAILQEITSSQDLERAAKFGDRLVNCNFHPDLEVGRLVINHLLERGYLEDPLWKDVILHVMAGMLVRNPKTLDDLLETNEKDTGVLDEVRQHLHDDLLRRKDRVNYQMSWNRFFAAGWSSTKLRYYIVKILLGGLVQSNSVEEYVREYRRFFVEVAKGYLSDGNRDYTYLSVEEALQSTEATRRDGQGEAWSPQEMS